MCGSVPQIEATFTFTRTSAGPTAGMGTSRISTPAFGSPLTTADIKFDMTIRLSKGQGSMSKSENVNIREPLILTPHTGRTRLTQALPWTRRGFVDGRLAVRSEGGAAVFRVKSLWRNDLRQVKRREILLTIRVASHKILD